MCRFFFPSKVLLHYSYLNQGNIPSILSENLKTAITCRFVCLFFDDVESQTPLCGAGVNLGYTTPPTTTSTVYQLSQGGSRYHDVGIKPTRGNHYANTLVGHYQRCYSLISIIFCTWAGPWQVMLKQADGSYACVAESATRFTLGEVNILNSLFLFLSNLTFCFY